MNLIIAVLLAIGFIFSAATLNLTHEMRTDARTELNESNRRLAYWCGYRAGQNSIIEHAKLFVPEGLSAECAALEKEMGPASQPTAKEPT